MSSDLTWLIVRKWNSNIHKTQYGIHFSSEAGNVANISSKQYSGFSGSKPVYIDHDGSAIVVKTKKADVTAGAVASGLQSKKVSTQGARNASRKVAKLVDSYGRPDLHHLALARTSKLVAAATPKLSTERLSRKEKRATSKAEKKGKKSVKSTQKEKDADEDELPELV